MEVYRRMTGREKLERVIDLNRTVEILALARIRKRYGSDLSEREERLLRRRQHDREHLPRREYAKLGFVREAARLLRPTG